MTPTAIVSIHDVMPETLDRVDAIIARLERSEISPVTLLVVPGRAWTERQIDRLRELAARGYPLAAHGWVHHTRPRKLYHRLHSLLASRNVAEHLDLDSAGVLDLLKRSKAWFAANGLPEPDFYVPPAWALGWVSKADLARAPFKRIETTRGLLFPPDGRRAGLPLTGFEADTRMREAFLRPWNSWQARSARRSGRPLRISIHPFDPEYRLNDQMDRILDDGWRFIGYDAVDAAG